MGLFQKLKSLFGGEEKAPDTARSPAPSVGNLGAMHKPGAAAPPVEVETPPPSIGNILGMGGAGGTVTNRPALDAGESGHVGPPSGRAQVHRLPSDEPPKTLRSRT